MVTPVGPEKSTQQDQPEPGDDLDHRWERLGDAMITSGLVVLDAKASPVEPGHQETVELPTVTIYEGDDTWHDGPGWYWVDDDYPDEGSCGAFLTRAAAEAHAIACGYAVGTSV